MREPLLEARGIMLPSDLKPSLPTSEELPCSDDTPVDNEDQNLLPKVLLFLLSTIWADQMDWYFGVDMAIYHTTGVNLRVPVVPDGFLSVGVERRKGGPSRRSYGEKRSDWQTICARSALIQSSYSQR